MVILRKAKVDCILILANIKDDFDAYCSGERASNFIGRLSRAYPENLDTFFCSNACPCRADKGNFPTAGDYDHMKVHEDGASMVVDCPRNPVRDVKKVILSFIGWMEERWQCSGLCTVQKYYYYSDVNNGQPIRACKENMLDYINRWYMGTYALVIISAVIIFLGSISSLFYICCGGERKDEKYARVER